MGVVPCGVEMSVPAAKLLTPAGTAGATVGAGVVMGVGVLVGVSVRVGGVTTSSRPSAATHAARELYRPSESIAHMPLRIPHRSLGVGVRVGDGMGVLVGVGVRVTAACVGGASGTTSPVRTQVKIHSGAPAQTAEQAESDPFNVDVGAGVGVFVGDGVYPAGLGWQIRAPSKQYPEAQTPSLPHELPLGRSGAVVAVAVGLGTQTPSLQYPLLHWPSLLHR